MLGVKWGNLYFAANTQCQMTTQLPISQRHQLVMAWIIPEWGSKCPHRSTKTRSIRAESFAPFVVKLKRGVSPSGTGAEMNVPQSVSWILFTDMTGPSPYRFGTCSLAHTAPKAQTSEFMVGGSLSPYIIWDYYCFFIEPSTGKEPGNTSSIIWLIALDSLWQRFPVRLPALCQNLACRNLGHNLDHGPRSRNARLLPYRGFKHVARSVQSMTVYSRCCRQWSKDVYYKPEVFCFFQPRNN